MNKALATVVRLRVMWSGRYNGPLVLDPLDLFERSHGLVLLSGQFQDTKLHINTAQWTNMRTC